MINRTILDNGITVITERIPYIRSVSLGVWIKSGSNMDPNKKNGLAHFTEHMLFKGTKKRSIYEIVAEVENLGGNFDAFTSRDNTCFCITIMDEYLETGIDILSDIIQNSIFPEEEIEKEKNIVSEEIKSSIDIPEEFVQDYFADNILKPHKESNPILGYIETVLSITRNDLYEFINGQYLPDNIVISAAGSLNHCDIIKTTNKYFKNTKKPIININNKINSENTDITHIIKRDISQTHVCLGTKIFGYENDNKIPLYILNTILSGGMSGRLFQNIREKYGLVYSIFSFYELFADVGYFATYTATDNNKYEKVIELIIKEFKKLKNKNVTIKEFQNAKTQLKGNIVIGMESSTNRMNRLAKNEIYLKKVNDINDVIKQINDADYDDFNELIKEIMDESKLKTVILTN